jgi:hypothetical protein
MKEKIKHVIIKGTTVYLFTEEPEKDLSILQEAYEKRDEVGFDFPLGYETPELAEYNFLGKEHKCISLWFDNEDVPEFFTNY